MFDAWKNAWRDAVDNFWRELNPEGPGPDPARRIAAMHRDLSAARAELDRIDGELARARRQLAEEREAEQSCLRRESLARGIGDEETARIAAEFAGRHAERAAVLARKLDAIEAERTLRARDLTAMESAMEELGPHADHAGTDDPPAERDSKEFRRLQEEEKERIAEQRLEELKRKMR